MKSKLNNFIFHLLLYICNHVISHIPSHTIRLAFYRKLMGCDIGSHSHILLGAFFRTRNNFKMGCNSIINQDCELDNRGYLTIGSNVSISSRVSILTQDHDILSPDFVGRAKPVVIEDYVFIGVGSIVLPGVTIHKGAVVSAGSVVMQDVDPYIIVAGNPAKPVGERIHELNYTIDYGRLLH